MGDGSGVLSDMPRGLPYVVCNPSSMNTVMVKCEYCGRGNHLSNDLNCMSCGAALPMPDAVVRSFTEPAMLYNSQMFSEGDFKYLGQPGRNIPVNTSLIQGALSAAVAMFPKR
jgi:hypothetical protein